MNCGFNFDRITFLLLIKQHIWYLRWVFNERQNINLIPFVKKAGSDTFSCIAFWNFEGHSLAIFLVAALPHISQVVVFVQPTWRL